MTTPNISTERNRAKCIICYDPHSSLENGPGVQRQFSESCDLLQRALDIKLPTSFNEYGEISICKPCFDGQFKEVEFLYEILTEIEKEFKSKAYNIATSIIDSVYKSQYLYLNQNLTAGNAFDSTRSLTYHKWISCYTKEKEKETAASKESNVEEMDVETDNAENEVTITTQSTTEITTVLNKSIQSDTNSLVNGKLEKIATANANASSMTTALKENEKGTQTQTQVADDSDSGYKNPNSIIAHGNGNGNDTCVKTQDQQQIEPNIPTTTTTTMNKFNEPFARRKELFFLKRYNPVKQKVGRPKKKSTDFVNPSPRRSQVQEASRKKFNFLKGYFPVNQRVGRPSASYPKKKSQVQENQLQRQKQDFKFRKYKQDPESEEISPEVKRSKRIIKKPMHYDEQNYIYDSAGNGKKMFKQIVQERRKFKEQKEAARSIRKYRSSSSLNQSPEELELEADDENEDEDEELGMEGLVYVPNKWKPSADNSVDSEEEDIDLNLVKNQEFVIENSEGEEIDCVDFKGRKRNSNGIGSGQVQGQKTNNLVLKEEVDEEMIEKEKLTEVKLESNKFKCVFCSKFFSSLEMKIEHEVLHAIF